MLYPRFSAGSCLQVMELRLCTLSVLSQQASWEETDNQGYTLTQSLCLYDTTRAKATISLCQPLCPPSLLAGWAREMAEHCMHILRKPDTNLVYSDVQPVPRLSILLYAPYRPDSKFLKHKIKASF